MNNSRTYCGIIPIIGRSNVGKSTLFNKLIGQKISITSKKVQTTCHNTYGIHTQDKYQKIYIDTPGLRTTKKHFINKVLDSSIGTTRLVVYVTEHFRWTTEDTIFVNKLQKMKLPVILIINKIDKLHKLNILLPYLQYLSNQMNFLEIIPVSAKTGINIDNFIKIINKNLPEAIHHFPKNYVTNQSKSLIVSELIREKIIRFLGAELPYLIDVKIESFTINLYGNYCINGLILVRNDRHKKIVVGNKGAKIKIISVKARKDIQEVFKVSVHLTLWVKVS